MNRLIIGFIVLLILIGGAFWLSGQQENSTPADQDTETPNSENTHEFDVVGTPFEFSVKEIRVKKGDTVVINFTNGQGVHDWVVDEFDAKTAVLQEGESETIQFTVDQAGEFEYYCSVGNHRELGMVGKLIVEDTEEQTAGNNDEIIIVYSDNGYSETNLTIEKGDTVTFRNDSSRDMWPASDIHPTHTIYSEFDSRGGIVPGGKYSFTFERTGAWGFHDHLNPFQVGVINVTE